MLSASSPFYKLLKLRAAYCAAAESNSCKHRDSKMLRNLNIINFSDMLRKSSPVQSCDFVPITDLNLRQSTTLLEAVWRKTFGDKSYWELEMPM